MSDGQPSKSPVDILLVEDNPGDIRLTEEAFRESRLANTLHVVTDGIEALDFLRQTGDYADATRPDIILLDLNLPRMNGDEVLEQIHEELPDISRIPVIILTSSETEEDIAKSYELWANAYMTKPVDPAEFIETIQTFNLFWLEIVQLPSKERGQ